MILSIDLLQERRAALISAAVTGKIDVREFAGMRGQGDRCRLISVEIRPHN